MLPRGPLSPLLSELPLSAGPLGSTQAILSLHQGHSCMPASKSSTDGTSESRAHISPKQSGPGQCGSDRRCSLQPSAGGKG